MLILTRRVGESIMIGDNVIVKVLGVRSGQIKLGIEAPKNTSVHREEIYRRIQNEEAGVDSGPDGENSPGTNLRLATG